MIDIAHLRELLEKATAGPWTCELSADIDGERVHGISGPPHTEDYGSGPETFVDRIVETDCGVYGPEKPDAALICAAVNALPALLEIAEAACAYRDAASDIDNDGYDPVLESNAHHALLAAVDRSRTP